MKFRPVNAKGNDYGIKITITERQGNTFKGKSEVSNGVNFQIEGTIDVDVVKYKDVDKGHKYEGKLVGSELALRFEGFGLGVKQPVRGTVFVTLVK